MKFQEGNIVTTEIRNNAGSYYLLLSPEIMDYLGVTKDDILAMKFERSKKFGPYIGVGKKK
jgi:hypothetical protein